MNNTENELLFVKEQIETLTDDMSKLRLQIISLISQNGELYTALEKTTYWLLNVAIKNNISFECLKTNKELLGEKRYLEIAEAAEHHVKQIKDFQDGWKKDSHN
jgi:hypothetical protein